MPPDHTTHYILYHNVYYSQHTGCIFFCLFVTKTSLQTCDFQITTVSYPIHCKDPDKEIYFLTHQFKHVFWVLKESSHWDRTVSLRRFFWASTTYVKKIVFLYSLLSGGLTLFFDGSSQELSVFVLSPVTETSRLESAVLCESTWWAGVWIHGSSKEDQISNRFAMSRF